MNLTDETKFFKDCFDGMEVGVLVFDSNKRIVFINKSFAQFFDYTEHEVLKEKVGIFFQNCTILNDIYLKATVNSSKKIIETIGVTKQGEEFHINLIFNRIQYNNILYFKLLISHLTTNKKLETSVEQLQELLRKERALNSFKTKFIALASQEFKNADEFIPESSKKDNFLQSIDEKFKRIVAQEHKISTNTNTENTQSIILDDITNIKQFLAKKRVYKYQKDETIFCKDNKSNHLFLIKKGVVKTYKINELGKEFNTGFYTDNQYFGFASFVKNTTHSENSKAVTDTKLYKINSAEIKSIVSNNNHVVYNFIDLLAGNLIETNKKLLLSVYGSVRKRTAVTLLNLVVNYPLKKGSEIYISRENLANSIGIAKETLIRTLHDFKNEKLIEISSKYIKIIAKEKLLHIY